MIIQAFVFDLDDTLYREHDYVYSGFYAVARSLSEMVQMNEEDILSTFVSIWKEYGRGKVFDIGCDKLNIKANISDLVAIYRSHKPKLMLYSDAEQMLNILKKRGIPTGIITDGLSMMQWNKIEALGLTERVDRIIVTDDLGGPGYWKPHPLPYRTILQQLNVPAEHCIYVGDNPDKDFITARKLGMKTARIVRPYGDHMQMKRTPDYEADRIIFELTDLLDEGIR